MVAGHLQEKNGRYYIVLSYTDVSTGKRKQPWIATGLSVRGNKKKAEEMLLEKRRSFIVPKTIACGDFSDAMLFSDYMEKWLNIIKDSVAATTFSSYTNMVKKKIAPYFRKLGVTLGELNANHIQNFYIQERKSVSASTVIHEHANIHKGLKYAVQLGLIPFNPADRVERPRKGYYVADYYNASELEKLFEVTATHKFSLLIQMAAFYGLRKSELLGLKWSAFDFENNTIVIKHILTQAEVDGKRKIVTADRAKTKASLRSLPLVNSFRDKLIALREHQERNKIAYGRFYDYEYDGYVFVDELGRIFNPNGVSAEFRRILERNKLRHIRFHDLRHSCASLLLTNNIPMKMIQEWLGHSDISTTSNIYAHLDAKSKNISAKTIEAALQII